MEKKVIKVETGVNERVDKYLKTLFPEYSREYFKHLCKSGLIKLNNLGVEPDEKVNTGDLIEIFFPQRTDFFINKSQGFEIIFENNELLVINKPSGLIVHPSKKFDTRKSLIDYLEEKYKPQTCQNWPLERPFLVHRLDKDTSGIMVIAKTPRMQYCLSQQFQKRKVQKVYLAIVSGIIKEKTGEIIAPIEKHRGLIKVGSLGKDAKTKFKVITTSTTPCKVSYLELYPQTGRTHQIRAHLSYINHPVVGDSRYNGNLEIDGKKISRVMLHAYKIKFLSTTSKKSGDEQWLEFSVPPPEDFCSVLSLCRL